MKKQDIMQGGLSLHEMKKEYELLGTYADRVIRDMDYRHNALMEEIKALEENSGKQAAGTVSLMNAGDYQLGGITETVIREARQWCKTVDVITSGSVRLYFGISHLDARVLLARLEEEGLISRLDEDESPGRWIPTVTEGSVDGTSS